MSEMDVHADGEVPENEEEAMDIEAPEADIVEQQTPLHLDLEEPLTPMPFDVDEADAAEQSRVVELDEDDYR